jgi:hypothetical protein
MGNCRIPAKPEESSFLFLTGLITLDLLGSGFMYLKSSE